MEPVDTAKIIAIIWIPWSIKLLYGVIADTIPVCGTRKKGWLLIIAVIQFISLLLLATLHNISIGVFLLLQLLVNSSAAFGDVIVDALMVMQAKRDPEQGSQELQVAAWAVTGITALAGSIVGAFLTGFVNPYWCFGYYAIFSAFTVIAAYIMNPLIETEGDDYMALSIPLNGEHTGRKRGFCEEIRHNYRIVKNQFKVTLFQRVMLFYILTGVTLVCPSEFLYYYKLNVLGITQF